MTSKMLVFTLAMCLILAFATGASIVDEKTFKNQDIQPSSLPGKEASPVEGTKKRSLLGSLSVSSVLGPTNNLRKAIDQQQKADLELATEKTKLEELEKLVKGENIDDTTPSEKLSKWQKRLLNRVDKTKKKIENLNIKTAMSKTLVEKLSDSSTALDKNERQIKDRTSKIIKALAEQQKANLELAMATTKLEELTKQKEAEAIAIETAPDKHTKWQKKLLENIVKAKEKKGDATVAAFVAKTKIDQLKQQLTEVGGSLDSIVTTSSKIKKKINEKLLKEKQNLLKIKADLAMATTKLEHLEKEKEHEAIDEENIKSTLTKKQKKLLNNIEKAKEKKYNLTLKAALGKTLIEQLKLQLDSNGEASSN